MNPPSEPECSVPEDLQFGFRIFRLSPFFASPIYGTAVYLLIFHSGIHARRIRIIYLRNLALWEVPTVSAYHLVSSNVLCMVTISIVLCPIFYLPMIGYQAIGLVRFVDINLAIPPIFTVYCLLGVAVSIMNLFFYRLKAIASMHMSVRNQRILTNLRRLVYVTYVFLLLTCISFLGLLTVQSSQPTIKPMMFERYHISEVWCPKFIVADPASWQIIIAIITSILFVSGAFLVVLLCGAFTLVLLLSARRNLSPQTLKIQKTFTAVLIVQAVVHVIFILVPIVCIAVAVYLEIWIRDGGLFFFLVESQQGTASTLVFIFTHSVTKKSFKYAEYRIRKFFGLTRSDNIWRVSKVEARSKSVV